MFLRKLFVLNFVLITFNLSFSQNISGVINVYQNVTKYTFCRNSVLVPNSTNFSSGDKVLLIQMKGAVIDISNTINSGTILSYGNAGNYEFAIINNIVGNEIFLRDSIRRNYDDSGCVQIVKVPIYNNATVTDTLKCLPWNGLYGGILVFEVSGTLTLNAPIDVSNKGFLGGAKFYCDGQCLSTAPDYVRPSITPFPKGEGIVKVPYTIGGGRGSLANGGGGSGALYGPGGITDAYYLGGGGGGNFGNGGRGGKSSNYCPTSPWEGGLGGKSLTYSTALNKIFMAGGGGVGHHKFNSTGNEYGTNGGGMVILKANTVICNNQTIIANALDVPFISGIIGRSGGGAGGTIALEVQSYSGTLNINVTGGKGGNSSGTNKFGPGGGGGGGTIWVNQATTPLNFSLNLSGGLNGIHITSGDSWGATSGESGGILTGLALLQPLNAPFVRVTDATTITTNSPLCEGDTLHLTAGTVPVGINYSWIGPNGFTSNLQYPTINNVTSSDSGRYMLEVIVQGCPGPPTLSDVYVGKNSTPPLTSNDSICKGSVNPALYAHGKHIRWYSDSLLSNLLCTDTIFHSLDTAAGLHTYYVTQTDSLCKSNPSLSELNIYPNAPQLVINNLTVCYGSPVPPFICNANGTTQWYSDSLLTNLVYSGNTFNSNETNSGSYHYFASLYDTIYKCNTLKKEVVLTIMPQAYASACNDTSICLGDTAQLFVNAPNNASFLWSTGSSTQQISINPNTVTKYYVTVNNSCGSAIDSVSVSISPLAPTSVNDTVCFGTSNPGLVAIGTNIKWYSDSLLTNLLSTNAVYCPSVSNVGVHPFYITQSNVYCESAESKVYLVIKPTPSPPLINSQTICHGETISPFIGNENGNFSWYSDSMLTDLIFTGDTFISSESNVGFYRYYVTLTDTISSCISLKSTVTLNVNPLPDTEICNDTSICKNTTANLFVNAASNATYLWNNSAISSHITVSPNSETQYYVTISNSCGTEIKDVLVSITPLPPLTTNDTTCFGNQNPGLTATGNNLHWYSDSLLNNLLYSGQVYQPSVSNIGTHAFFVTQSNGICESFSSKSNLEILSAVPQPSVNNQIICYGEASIPFSATENGVFQWYSDSLLTNLLHTGNTFSSPEINSGTYYYYVTLFDSIYSCTSPKKEVSLKITPLPFANASNDTIICKNGTATLSVNASSNSTFLWSTGSSSQQIAVNPTSQTKYYVTVNNGCGIAIDSVNVAISPLPPVTVIDTTCFGNANPYLTATGSTIHWYSDLSLSNLLHTGQIYQPTVSSVGTHTFYVTQTNGNCESYPSISKLEILPPVSQPSVSDQTICYGIPDTPFIANGIGIFKWYSDSLLTNLIQTGNTFNSPETNPGSYFYYVTLFDGINSCTSAKKEVSLKIIPLPVASASNDTSICKNGSAILNINTFPNSTYFWSTGANTLQIAVNPLVQTKYYVTVNNACGHAVDSVNVSITPLSPVTSFDTVCFGNSNPYLTATGNNLHWYSDSLLSNLLHTGPNYQPSQNNVGSYCFYVTQSNGTCESYASTSKLEILPNLPQPSVSDLSVCYGVPNTPFTGIGNGVFKWYSDSLLNNLIYTGNSFTSSETNPGTYYYYVTIYDSVYSCTSSKKEVTLYIKSPPVAIACNDTSVCKNSTATLYISSDTSSSFLWSSGDTTQQISVTPFTQTHYFVTVSNSCGIAVDSITVSISPLAPLTANDTVCYGYSNPGLSAIGNNIKWYSDSTLLDLLSTNPVFFSTDTIEGSHIYYVTQTENLCESDPALAILNILPSPVQPQINDQTVCIGYPIYPFVANANGIVYWYSDASLNNLIQAGDTLITSDSITGIYHYYAVAYDSVSMCTSATKDVFLIILPEPYPTICNDTTICEGDEAVLYINANTGSTYLWNNGATSQQVIVNPTSETQFSVTVTNGCGNANDSVTVFVNPHPNAFAGADTSICMGDSISITATGGISYLWNNGNNTSSFVVCPSTPSYFVVTVTDANSCSFTDDISISFSPNPQIVFSGDSTICAGFPTILTASGGINYLWNTGDTTASIIVSPINNELFYVTVTGSNHCKGNSDVLISVSNTNQVSITSDFSPENTIAEGQIITFTANPNNYDSYNFYIDNELRQSSNLNTFTTSSIDKDNFVSVTAYESDCPTNKDSIFIIVKPLPNAFTPFTKDGKNDIFGKGLDLIIINLWGQELYSGKTGWNGEYKGEKVPPGTYYYIVKLNEGTSNAKIHSGSINVVVK